MTNASNCNLQFSSVAINICNQVTEANWKCGAPVIYSMLL